MPHSFPSGLQTLIATGWYRIHPAIIITLGSGTVVKYSTLNISVDGHTFVDRLKSGLAAKMSLTRAPDRVVFDLWNGDSQAGLALIDPVTALDGATASYYRIYINPSNANEKYLIEELFGVLVVDPNSGADDETLSLTLVSETAAFTSLVGDMQVLNSCVYKYKGKFCGYVGILPTCDMSYDGVNGCRIHFPEEEAQARFGGHARDLDPGTFEQLRSFRDVDIDVLQVKNLLQHRYRREFQSCVTPDTLILVEDDNGQPLWTFAEFVKVGQKVINVLGQASRVVAVMPGTTTRLYRITTENGKQLRCSPSHPILTSNDDGLGKPAARFVVGDPILTYTDGQVVLSKVASIEASECLKPEEVVIYTLEGNRTFISAGIVSHNLKNILFLD